MSIFALLLIAAFLWSFNDSGKKPVAGSVNRDTIPPIIRIALKEDIAYLNTFYKDPGSEVVDDLEAQCLEAKVTGTIDTRTLGTYFLNYDAEDHAGNKAITVTRTVHVVKSRVSFLNGIYNVACTCTAVIPGSPTIATSSESYIAAVTPGYGNNRLELSALRIGPERVAAGINVSGSNIEIDYTNLDYHISSRASGSISFAKNSFTIESSFTRQYPDVGAKYRCKNVYVNSFVQKRIQIKSSNH